MASWSSSFIDTTLDIITLFRNMTNRENPTLREKQIIQNSINEALQKICIKRYGSRLRFLESAISEATTSGTAYVTLDADLLYVMQGTVVIDSEDRILQEVPQEQMDQIDISSTLTGAPEIYSLSASSTGANYIQMNLWPTPDDTYTIEGTASKIVSEDGITEFPNYMAGAIHDMATYIAMKRIGFGSPALYKLEADQALEEIASQEGSDGPLHIPRGRTVYRGQRLQARSN